MCQFLNVSSVVFYMWQVLNVSSVVGRFGAPLLNPEVVGSKGRAPSSSTIAIHRAQFLSVIDIYIIHNFRKDRKVGVCQNSDNLWIEERGT